ncbi:MAG: hypothetical protein H6510_01310 [Acidobacteria bacterium]|nr:hypothetical protein [Acidobacteriota bacterium]MCB9396428.1 hypothetical protein [Acidobacteriota bacterium]
MCGAKAQPRGILSQVSGDKRARNGEKALEQVMAAWHWILTVSPQPEGLFFWGTIGLLASTQLVIVLLNQLEKHQFGSVHLGTLMTPLCTGFPNILIGILGQDRLADDLVLQLNIGNNLANTSLVVGLVMAVAGPLTLRAKKQGKDEHALWLSYVFLWFGSVLVLYLAHDGLISRMDGLLCMGWFALHHILTLNRRGKVAKKKRLGWKKALVLILPLMGAGYLIYVSLGWIETSLSSFSDQLGPRIGLFLGLLTVLPESFLLLRLALKQGRLGLSGIVGDCFVSVPLVVGLAAVLKPFPTPAIHHWTDPAAWTWIHLAVTMTLFTWVGLGVKRVPRWVGLVFMAVYVMVWWHSSRVGNT